MATQPNTCLLSNYLFILKLYHPSGERRIDQIWRWQTGRFHPCHRARYSRSIREASRAGLLRITAVLSMQFLGYCERESPGALMD